MAILCDERNEKDENLCASAQAGPDCGPRNMNRKRNGATGDRTRNLRLAKAKADPIEYAKTPEFQGFWQLSPICKECV